MYGVSCAARILDTVAPSCCSELTQQSRYRCYGDQHQDTLRVRTLSRSIEFPTAALCRSGGQSLDAVGMLVYQESSRPRAGTCLCRIIECCWRTLRHSFLLFIITIIFFCSLPRSASFAQYVMLLLWLFVARVPLTWHSWHRLVPHC